MACQKVHNDNVYSNLLRFPKMTTKLQRQNICEMSNKEVKFYRPAEGSYKLIEKWRAGVISENTGLIFLTVSHVDNCHFVRVTTRHRYRHRKTYRHRLSARVPDTQTNGEISYRKNIQTQRECTNSLIYSMWLSSETVRAKSEYLAGPGFNPGNYQIICYDVISKHASKLINFTYR